MAAMTTVAATVWAAVWNSIMWYVSERIRVLVAQAVHREMRMVVVSQAIVPQAVEVLVAQAVQRVVSQRVAVVGVGAIAALGSGVRYSSSRKFSRVKSFLLAGVSDQSQYGNKKQGLFHENW